MLQSRRIALVLLVVLALVPGITSAQSCAAPQSHDADNRSAISVRLDNDALGGRGQDQNYTGGTIVTLRSSDLTSFTDDPCLAPSLRWVNQKLAWLQPTSGLEKNMVFSVAHLAWTPADRLRTDVIKDDRPYASVLLFGLGYNTRRGAELTATQLRVGLAGPATQGERTQNAYHDVLGLERFQGWNNQLRNEVIIQLGYERLHRWSTAQRGQGWGADLISHWGGGLGNFATYANVGAEWRAGWRLPEDFGSAAGRPAGDNTAPGSASGKYEEWRAHGFAAIDVRGVVHDLTLDGNTFATSHRVDKRRGVAELGLGFSLQYGAWKLAIARYLRTREFTLQKDVSAYGSISLSRWF